MPDHFPDSKFLVSLSPFCSFRFLLHITAQMSYYSIRLALRPCEC